MSIAYRENIYPSSEGQRAVDYVRNDILLARGGSFLPVLMIIAALKALEELTGVAAS
jgi:hypothetical protein